jgi:hypothetical protein
VSDAEWAVWRAFERSCLLPALGWEAVWEYASDAWLVFEFAGVLDLETVSSLVC